MTKTIEKLATAAFVCVIVSTAHGTAILRFADSLEAYVQGASAQPGYRTPAVALGPPSTGHTPDSPMNNDPQTGEPNVVSLGQGGSITLSFNLPVGNQPCSAANPYGYDLLIWANAFQADTVTTPELQPGRFQEQGFVEVAKPGGGGQPDEWLLILPRIFHDSVESRQGPVPRDLAPAELLPPVVDPEGDFLASGDLGVSACLFDGFVDSVPARGSQLQTIMSTDQLSDVLLDDPATFAIEGLGGTGIDLSRAVRQASPGAPLLVNGHVQFVPVNGVKFIRITDARTGDLHANGQGPITTEVDGVIVLPDLRGCWRPFADADHDDDVDADDFGAFQTCYSGPGRQSATGCVCFDRDGDNDVDSADVAAFQACALTSGPAVPADVSCGD